MKAAKHFLQGLGKHKWSTDKDDASIIGYAYSLLVPGALFPMEDNY